MTVYIANAFSINMLSKYPSTVVIDKIDDYEEFCGILENAQDSNELVSAIGHEATARMVNEMCQALEYEVDVKANRVQVKLSAGDRLLVVQVLERLPEGKVLSYEEISEMLAQKKIGFFDVIVQ
mgnify:CR=1 FL=1